MIIILKFIHIPGLVVRSPIEQPARCGDRAVLDEHRDLQHAHLVTHVLAGPRRTSAGTHQPTCSVAGQFSTDFYSVSGLCVLLLLSSASTFSLPILLIAMRD